MAIANVTRISFFFDYQRMNWKQDYRWIYTLQLTVIQLLGYTSYVDFC
jgi:hypothetical protein